MDGQCECGLEGEGTVGRGDAKSGCGEATGQIQRPRIEVGKRCGGKRIDVHISSRHVL